MPRRPDFPKLVAERVGLNKTVQFAVKRPDGGEDSCTVAVRKLSVDQCYKLGLDPATQRLQLYCEIKLHGDGRELHAMLIDHGGKDWSLKQVVADFGDEPSFDISANVYFKPSEEYFSLLEEIITKGENMA